MTNFYPGMQDWIKIQKSINIHCHRNRLKKKNQVIIMKKNLTIKNMFMIKIFNRLEIERNFLSLILKMHKILCLKYYA